jgi:phosphomannomutase
MSREKSQLLAEARAWIDGDPDPETRAELSALIGAGALTALNERLRPLTFGTAGLRGAVGAGPGRMNLAVVTRTASGIARYVASLPGAASLPVVIGFDARPTSRAFAEASAGVLLAAGLRVVAFSSPVATPLCAFLGRELGASITIVVTASHNPRPDNGYKVYGANAVQIVAPVDTEIAQHIAHSPPARQVARLPVDFSGPPLVGLELQDPAQLDAYFQAVSTAIPAGSAHRELPIVHSALHGVGTAPMLRLLADAGFTHVHVVPAQAEPDGTFPTTPFPNPEEPGTLDLALVEAERRSAALLLVNDPDADRLAAAARLDGVLSVLDGNQVGALLADQLLSAQPPGAITPLVLSSVVSSPLVGLMARARAGHSERTHTGFKWLWNAALELERRGTGRARAAAPVAFASATRKPSDTRCFPPFATKTASPQVARWRSSRRSWRRAAPRCSIAFTSCTSSTACGRALRVTSRWPPKRAWTPDSTRWPPNPSYGSAREGWCTSSTIG